MKVIFKGSFLKAVSKLSGKRLKMRIARTIEDSENAPSVNELKNFSKLKIFDDYYRIRMGQYRIGVKLENHTLVFVAMDIYRIFPLFD